MLLLSIGACSFAAAKAYFYNFLFCFIYIRQIFNCGLGSCYCYEVCTMGLTITFGVICGVGACAGTVGIVVAPALSIVLPAALNLSLTVLRVASHSAVFARLP